MATIEIEYGDHVDHKGNDFGQWFLYVNKRHVGLVQKQSGAIHLTCQLADELIQAVKKDVADKTGNAEPTVGIPVQIELEQEDDEDEST